MKLEQCQLDDVLAGVIDYRGKTPTKTESGVRLVTAKVIKKGRVINDGPQEYIDPKSYDEVMRRGIPQRNDIFITTEAPLGELALWNSDEQIALAQRVILLRPNPRKIDTHFLFYHLQSIGFQSQLHANATGTTVPGIKNPVLRSLTIQFPNIDQQREIGQILSNYDDLIETNRRRIALLEESARLLYREWFVNLRFPGYELAKWQDGLPEGWLSGFASDCVNVLSGGTPNTKTERYWEGDIPFFTPKDCSGSMFVLRTEKTVTEDGLQACNSRLFAKETIFITARGTVGKLALAQRPMAMNQSCYALTPKSGLDNLFLFLAMEDGVEHLKTMASGGVFDTIVVDTFKRMPFVCPTTEMTKNFGNIVRPIFSQIENLLLQNFALASARDELLPKLMSGAIRV